MASLPGLYPSSSSWRSPWTLLCIVLVGLLSLVETSDTSKAELLANIVSLFKRMPADYRAIIDTCGDLLKLDNEEFQAYYFKGRAEWAIGNIEMAESDLSRAIRLRPNYDIAYATLGNFLFKTGDLERALDAFNNYLSLHKGQSESDVTYQEVIAQKALVESGLTSIASATKFFNSKKYSESRAIFKGLLRESSQSIKFYNMSVECSLRLNDIDSALMDLSKLASLQSDPSESYLMMARLYFAKGNLDLGLDRIRNCTHYNPDHKVCVRMHGFMRTKSRQFQKAESKSSPSERMTAVKEFLDSVRQETIEESNVLYHPVVNQLLKPFIIKSVNTMCSVSRAEKEAAEAINWCCQLVDLDPLNVDSLVAKADAYSLAEEYDMAHTILVDAEKIFPENEAIMKAKEKVKDDRTKEARRDYYDILGIPKKSDITTVKKAYRKLAMKWHPDRHPDKELAEKKFTLIGTAYQTLSDPDKKMRYDQYGFDQDNPDHMTGQQRGGFAGGPGGAFFDLNDLFRQFGGGGGAGGGGRRQGGGGQGFQFHFDL